MSDSRLATCLMPAYVGNYTAGRAKYGEIGKITIHHMAGNLSVEQLGWLWQTPGRQGSSHYGVNGTQVGQYVAENDIAWTDSNWASNCTSVTIETANSGGEPDWPVSDATLQTLIQLVADIAKRCGLHPLICGETLTWHSMYAATACPGPYLLSRMQYITDEANKLNESEGGETMPMSTSPTKMQFGAMSQGDAAQFRTMLSQKGIPYNESGGVIKTNVAVSAGDQVPLMQLARDLGNIPYAPLCEGAGGEVSRADYEQALQEIEAQKAAKDAAENRLASVSTYFEQAESLLKRAGGMLGV